MIYYVFTACELVESFQIFRLFHLQESYGKVVQQLICEALTNDLSVKDVTPITATLSTENVPPPSSFSYSFYNFQSNAAACSLTLPDLVVAFANAVWYHSSLAHLSLVPG
jgi:hypothetical protein